MKARLYNIVAINEKHGWKEYMTAFPMSHADCCVMLGKISKHPARRIQLEEVVSVPATSSLVPHEVAQ